MLLGTKIHTRDYVELPLPATTEQGPRPVLSLKKSGDMAFHKREKLLHRREFFRKLNVKEGSVYALSQTHSRDVVIVGNSPPSEYYSVNADGMLTANRNAILSVTVADCLPIFIHDRANGAFGIVHSGWKGTGIVLEAIRKCESHFKSRKEDLSVLIGPGIGVCCYNVDQERYNLFRKEYGHQSVRREDGEYYLNLRKANLVLLNNYGIGEVTVIDDCTCCNPLFSSCRREGQENFSRMLACIGFIG
jgi:YfiH family protein